jgi:hypothetical protein
VRLIDQESLDALEGSRSGEGLTVWAWRDGGLELPEPLEVISWSWQEDAGDTVTVGQTLSLTVADPDGTLGAWRFEDPLSVAGTELQVIYNIGGAGSVNAGIFRIVGNAPDEVTEWRRKAEYGLAVPDSDVAPHERSVPITRAVVKLVADDLTRNVDRDEFEAPQSASGSTVLAEFAQLTKDHFPTVIDAGVNDANISPFLVFESERLAACQDLLSRVNARYRMGGDGECHVYPARSAPVWRVEPTRGLVSATRQQAADGLYNRWVVTGKESEDGTPVRASASIDNGPLRYGGPHGRAPFKYSSEMITTTGQALAYAIQLRDESLSALAVELSVTTVPRPELQAGDWIEVGCPFEDRVVYLPGWISSISRGGDPVPGPTSLKVRCSYDDVESALSRAEWADHLTAGMPPLTWDRMPSTWGSLPPFIWNNL